MKLVLRTDLTATAQPSFSAEKDFMNRNVSRSKCNTDLPGYSDTCHIDRKFLSFLIALPLTQRIFPRPTNANVTVIVETCAQLEIHVSTFSESFPNSYREELVTRTRYGTVGTCILEVSLCW